MLDKYQVNREIFPLIELQLRKYFDYFNLETKEIENKFQSQLASLNKEGKELKIRRGLNKIDKDTYDVTLNYLNEEIQNIITGAATQIH